MSNATTTTRHCQVLTHRRPATADLSMLDMVMEYVAPSTKSVRVQK